MSNSNLAVEDNGELKGSIEQVEGDHQNVQFLDTKFASESQSLPQACPPC